MCRGNPCPYVLMIVQGVALLPEDLAAEDRSARIRGEALRVRHTAVHSSACAVQEGERGASIALRSSVRGFALVTGKADQKWEAITRKMKTLCYACIGGCITADMQMDKPRESLCGSVHGFKMDSFSLR
jgi:hypothetical protein